MPKEKVTILSLLSRKLEGPRIVALTAYDALMARLLDQALVDILLVGDTLGVVVQGHSTTLPVTIDDVCYHAKAVTRTHPRAHVVGDLPFLSYQVSDQRAVESAGKLLQEGGCESVKLEGGRRMAQRIRAIVAADIPVMGHVGLTPQSVHALGGYRVQGRTDAAEEELVNDALAVQDAGAFAIVLEGMPSAVAQRITATLKIPTIGIGAGPHCDGQVLVSTDVLGMEQEFRPRFVKRYAELGNLVTRAAEAFRDEVRGGTFPAEEHCYAKKSPQSRG